jgi:hypothetical protein
MELIEKRTILEIGSYAPSNQVLVGKKEEWGR